MKILVLLHGQHKSTRLKESLCSDRMSFILGTNPPVLLELLCTVYIQTNFLFFLANKERELFLYFACDLGQNSHYGSVLIRENLIMSNIFINLCIKCKSHIQK